MHSYLRRAVSSPKWLFLGLAIGVGVCFHFTYKRQPRSAILRDLNAFETKTTAAWGAGVIEVSRKAVLVAAVTNTPVMGINTDLNSDKTIKEQLHSSIVRFLEVYSAGDFNRIIEFHRIAPFKYDLSAILKDKQALTNMANLGIQFPKDDDGRIRAIWDYYNSRKHAEDFWNNYVAKAKATGKVLPEETSAVIQLQTDLLPEFQRLWKENRLSFDPIKITGISTQLLKLQVVRTNSIDGFMTNRKLFPGAQMRGPRMFIYDQTPNDIVATDSSCTFALASIGITHNARQGVVPLTLIFYWSPKHQKLLPSSITQHSFGAFLTIF